VAIGGDPAGDWPDVEGAVDGVPDVVVLCPPLSPPPPPHEAKLTRMTHMRQRLR
jgi:hypothetical protein